MAARRRPTAAAPKLKRSALLTETLATTCKAPSGSATDLAPPAEPAASPVGATKVAQVIALLSRAEGATIAQMRELTGWKARSVRGFMAGALKAKREIVITSIKADGARTYRIEAPAR